VRKGILIEPIPLPRLGLAIKLKSARRLAKGDERFFKRIFSAGYDRHHEECLDAAVASLPDPVSSAHVQSIAETILRTAREGERDPLTLQIIALMELQITPRH
jgi:hypothetical protein